LQRGEDGSDRGAERASQAQRRGGNHDPGERQKRDLSERDVADQRSEAQA